MTSMAIPESQLESWSHQGAVITSKNTYASIRANLESADAPYSDKQVQIYLQGSYGNDTNIRAGSDVDVVCELTSTFHRNLDRLPPDQIQAFHQAYSGATYHFSDFKQHVVAQLQAKYGTRQVIAGRKAVKVLSGSGRLGADVVVCCQYRDYHWFRSLSDQNYDKGIYFRTADGEEVVNYPRYHAENCTAKHQATNGRFKPIVRIVKNMRGHLLEKGAIGDDLAPSYFIEGLFYNVPDDQFSGDFGGSFRNCVNWLIKADRSRFVCPNRKHWLFGSSSVQWDDAKCSQFLDALINLWNKW
jgi:hypothetical protein